MIVTLTLDLPADLAERIYALPPATLNRYAIATLPGMLDDAEADADTEPVDLDFIAELRAADEETKRVGYIPFEDVVRQAEADDGPGFLERLRARQAAYKASEAHARFETSKAAHKAALLREREMGGASFTPGVK